MLVDGLTNDVATGFATLGARSIDTKTFDQHALEHALIQDLSPISEPSSAVANNVRLDLEYRSLEIGTRRIVFSELEFRIVTYLMNNQGVCVSRDCVSDALSSYAKLSNRTLDVHVFNIRRKLGVYANIIQTVRSRGYRLMVDGDFKISESAKTELSP